MSSHIKFGLAVFPDGWEISRIGVPVVRNDWFAVQDVDLVGNFLHHIFGVVHAFLQILDLSDQELVYECLADTCIIRWVLNIAIGLVVDERV